MSEEDRDRESATTIGHNMYSSVGVERGILDMGETQGYRAAQNKG
jgi:hypothetical protein